MNKKISKKKLREFGLLIGFGFPILIGWIIPAIIGHGFRLWTIWLGVSGLLLGVTAPRLLLYPYKSWMALGHALGWINSRVILGLVFLFVVQPIAFIMKFFGYDPLRKNKDNKKSYREINSNRKVDLTRIF
tara:strand:+ start:682 stop:1074 length:393 start_codon:yes stop_codon:yes gene_type:complete